MRSSQAFVKGVQCLIAHAALRDLLAGSNAYSCLALSFPLPMYSDVLRGRAGVGVLIGTSQECALHPLAKWCEDFIQRRLGHRFFHQLRRICSRVLTLGGGTLL